MTEEVKKDSEQKVQPLPTVLISTKKIVVPRIETDTRPVKGADWFPKPYTNMFACAKTNSGKSTVLTNIVDHIKSKATKIIIISPTVDLDPTYKTAIKKWEKAGNDVSTFKSIIDEDGVNLIYQFMDENKIDEDSDDEGNEQPRENIAAKPIQVQPTRKVLFTPIQPNNSGLTQISPRSEITLPTQRENIIAKPKKKTSTRSPKFIILLDDLGKEMRNSAVGQLLRTSRQYKTSVLASSQHLYDLEAASINQLQYVFLFSKFSEEKLKELYKLLSIFIPFEEFYKLYRDATAKPYSFLYISRDGEYRKGFNEKYILQ